MGAESKLIDASGRAITRAEVNAVRIKAMFPDRGQAAQPWAYEASRMYGGEVAGWYPGIRSPDSEINFNAEIIRARHRDLDRNDGWANGSFTRVTDGMVGSNFHVVPMPIWRALAAAGGKSFDAAWAAEFRSAVMAEWRMISDDPLFYGDAERMQSLTQQFYTAAHHKIVDGDALAKLEWMPERVGYGGARYYTALRLLDPDRLSNPFEAMDTHMMRGGVELDPQSGAPVAYHIRRAHQNDYFDASASMVWDRFERQTVWGRPIMVHDCERTRASQHRGVGILTPVLSRFKMLQKYDQVQLQAAVLRTVLGFFIKSPQDTEQVMMALNDKDFSNSQDQLALSNYQIMRNTLGAGQDLDIGGARVVHLAPGEDLGQVQPQGLADDFDVFEHTFLRSCAAASGESAEEISKDYSQTNYSSARAALLSVWRTMLRRRASFATGFATPIYAAFLEEMITRKFVPLPKNAPDFVSMRAAYSRCEWIGPGRGWIDPVKERQGEVLGLDAGFGTLRNTCADISGAWWQDVLDEREVEEAYMKQRGLHLPDWAGGDPASVIAEKPVAQ